MHAKSSGLHYNMHVSSEHRVCICELHICRYFCAYMYLCT